MKLNQKGIIAQVLILLLLAAGLVVGLYLVKNPQVFSPKARAAWLIVKDSNNTPLPFNSQGIPQSKSPNVILNIYSLLGIKSSVSSPSVPHDVSVKVAKSPTALGAAKAIDFAQDPVVLPFILEPGQNFIWVEFLDSLGRTERRTAQIDLTSSSVSQPISPTPTPHPVSGPVAPPPPVGGPGGGGGGNRPTPTPAARVISSFAVGESLADPNIKIFQNYVPGVIIHHTFKDTTPGQKFIFIKFMDDKGEIVQINGQDYISNSIELIEEAVATPTPTPVQTPVENNGADCPISHPQDFDIGTLKKLCYPSQMIRIDLKYLNNFDNQTLIDIGRATGDLGGFLANFTGERLLGLSPYQGAGFSLDILNELPSWRKQQLPGYIQDQLK